ncbi:hypothetical protein GCM10023340_30630 [Nocardioides marinquilinus]|uniref:Uncharacterized protein n=1 Tax=Nocardioides marinquilinus TaxID=1210400 RepID=A0ABP9PZE4_9ACTN
MLIRFIMLMALTLCRDGKTVDGLNGRSRPDPARPRPTPPDPAGPAGPRSRRDDAGPSRPRR